MKSIADSFKRGWKSGGTETRCGRGSTIAATSRLRRWLPEILEEFGIRSINDAGCGDMNWISVMNLAKYDYLGVDVLGHDRWSEFSGNPLFQFRTADICSEALRSADLTICRDVLIHLPNSMVQSALDNFRISTKYLLTTSFDQASNSNRDIVPGKYAELDLTSRPFNLGVPLMKLQEKYRGKYLGLWLTERREQDR